MMVKANKINKEDKIFKN